MAHWLPEEHFAECDEAVPQFDMYGSSSFHQRGFVARLLAQNPRNTKLQAMQNMADTDGSEAVFFAEFSASTIVTVHLTHVLRMVLKYAEYVSVSEFVSNQVACVGSAI